jgi:hypothetical protein
MTTILIPTDFTLQSLNMVKDAASKFRGQRLNIILFHALYIPTDIHNLLFLSPKVPHEKITEEFRHACTVIKKKNSNEIAQITFRHMYGSTNAVFRNFIEANKIDAIFMPEHVVLKKVYDDSVELRPLFKKASIPFITEAAPAIEVRKTSNADRQSYQELSLS